MTRDEWAKLAEEYREGSISEADAQRMADAIRAGGPDAEMILAELEFSGALTQALDDSDADDFVRTFRERINAEAGAEEFTTKFRLKHLTSQRSASSGRATRAKLRPISRRRKSSSGSPWALAIAASLALAVGLIYWSQSQPKTESLATLADIRGALVLEHDGRLISSANGTPLFATDIVTASSDGAATILFSDGTRVELLNGAKVALNSDAGAKRVELRNGTLEADINKQPAGKPMNFTTPHARAIVLGTSLKLATGASGTRLDVTHGKVRLTLPQAADGIDVVEGRSAEVTSAGQLALIAEPPTVPVVVEKKPEVFGPKSGRPFNDSSPWNAPIPENPVLDPNSATIVKNLGNQASLSMYTFAPPIYNADATTPVRKVVVTKPNSKSPFIGLDVRIPDGAQPNSGKNSSFFVLDWSARRTYEFYRFKWNGADAQVYGGGSISFDGNGVDMSGSGSAGASQIAGLIRLHEIEAGRIDHAISIASKFASKETRYPSRGNDGDITGPGGLAVGARVQLDPTLDVAAIPGITKGELAIALALQKYGGYCIGKTTQPILMSFELAPDATSPTNPGKIYSENGFPNAAEITRIPWNRLRVLKLWHGRDKD